MSHKGMKEFQPGELTSIALGQNGFTVMGAGEYLAGGLDYPDIAFWVAVKAVEADAVVDARALTKEGMDLTKHGSGEYQSNAAANGITITNGDIVYGAFDKIEVATGDFIIAYIGRQSS